MGAQSKEAPVPAWGLAVAGATGAALANTLVYPLDMLVILCLYMLELMLICSQSQDSSSSTG